MNNLLAFWTVYNCFEVKKICDNFSSCLDSSLDENHEKASSSYLQALQVLDKLTGIKSARI